MRAEQLRSERKVMARNARLGEFVVCPKCLATALSQSPHGDGQPCPLVVKEHEAMLAAQKAMIEAEVQRVDAQRMSAIKAGVGMEDTLSWLRERIDSETGGEEEE